jgi:hypothetical protein
MLFGVERLTQCGLFNDVYDFTVDAAMIDGSSLFECFVGSVGYVFNGNTDHGNHHYLILLSFSGEQMSRYDGVVKPQNCLLPSFPRKRESIDFNKLMVSSQFRHDGHMGFYDAIKPCFDKQASKRVCSKP